MAAKLLTACLVLQLCHMRFEIFCRLVFCSGLKAHEQFCHFFNSSRCVVKSYLAAKIVSKLGNILSLAWIIFLAFFLFSVSANAATTISFMLDEPCKTSAGVYKPDGTLVRTLWSNVRYYAAGFYSATWDGNDDNGNPVSAGTYAVKVLQHNVNYVWDGAIGNSSLAQSGPTVHRGFYTMHGMAISGNLGFYCQGYNEGQFGFHTFVTSNPNQVTNSWIWVVLNGSTKNSVGLANRNWWWTAADATNVYFACDASYNSSTLANYGGPGCIVAGTVTNQNPVTFSSGVLITNGPGDAFPSGIYVGTQPGLSGLAVQWNSNLLAASVAPDNKIYLFDKSSGASVASIPVSNPNGLAFATNGDLWAITGSNVVHYTSMNSTPTLAATYAFINPLAIAVCPTNVNIILVADGGSQQQIKAINSSGTLLWTYGLVGGYQANGPAVQTNKFWFVFDLEKKGTVPLAGTYICFAPDGSFWVGDGGNHRSLHISSSQNYLEQIMWQPHSYTDSVDANNPSRVFNQFLEFSVDYTKPLSNSWTLVNNWEAALGPSYTFQDNAGLWTVTTLTNGRTYCLIQNLSVGVATFEICELVSGSGVRPTGVYPNGTNNYNWVSMNPNGDQSVVAASDAKWYVYPRTGFDGGGNPTYGPIVTIGYASDGSTNPVPRTGSANGPGQTTVSSNNIIISLDTSLNNGFHLGGVKVGGTGWLWQASPSGTLNNDGHFEIGGGLTYPASGLVSIDNQVVYGYHGEFFRNQAQAAQYFHYLDDGLFVGQFGESNLGHQVGEGAIPGYAGNNTCPTMSKAAGSYYIYANDESSHGLQRWQMVNAQSVRELNGSGALGGSIIVTNPVVDFPTAVTGLPGNQSGKFKWNPVAGASSYNLRYSLINGGPYQAIAGNTTASNYTATGLTNGTIYYFAVTAIVGGSESIQSEQVSILPYDTTKMVVAAGRLDDANVYQLPINTTATNLANSMPALLGTYRNVGNRNNLEMANYGFGSLMNNEVGRRGYLIYDFKGAGVNLSNLSTGFTITNDAGWQHLGFAYRYFSVDGVCSNNPAYGLNANPLGVIGVSVADTNYHFLTVFSPSKFSDPRHFTITLTSSNGDSASYLVNDVFGISHIFQFLFKGNVTLQVNDLASANVGTVQGLFLDDLDDFGSLLPPTDLRIISP